jgi:CHAT domain-containing protein
MALAILALALLPAPVLANPTLTGRTKDGREINIQWTPATAANSEAYQRLVERRLPESLAAFDRALELARREDWPLARIAGIHAGRAQTLYQIGRFADARADIEFALPHERDLARANAVFLYAAIARAMGEFRIATDQLRQLEPAAFVAGATQRPESHTRSLAWARHRIFVAEARNRRAWGDLLGAREMLEAALAEEQPTVGIRRDYARTLLDLGETADAFKEAQDALHQALNERGTSRRRPRPTWLEVADMELLSCLQVAAQTAAAAGQGAVADAHFATVAEMAARLGVPDEAVLARLHRATAWMRLRDARAAEVTSAWLAQIGEELGASPQARVRIEGRTLAGELAFHLGDHALVTQLLEPAVADVEAVRASASFEDRRDFLVLQANSYRRLITAHTRLNQPWEALLAAESLKARQLLDLIQPDHDGVSRDERLTTLREFQQRLPADLVALNYANADWADSPPVAIIVTRDRLVARELPVTGLRLNLEFLPRERILEAQHREVDVNRYGRSDEVTLAGLIAFYREALTAKREEVNARVPDVLAVAPVLHELLIEPIRADFGPRRRLLISPHGLLHYLPFDSLVNRQNQFIVGLYSTALTPSFLTTMALADRPKADYERPLIAFGGAVYDPKTYAEVMAGVGELRDHLRLLRETRENQVAAVTRSPYYGIFGGPSSNLAGTQAEVEEIGDILPGSKIVLGRQVSEAHVRQLAAAGELRRSRAVHFAVHGSALPHKPELSCLSLSYEGHFTSTMPPERDGKLSLAEIRALPLRADLVSLSACETGLGAIFAGEGVVGLPAAFLTAGGDRVLASLWVVNDVSTTFFMVDFYRLHFVEGLPADIAIARAKRTMLGGQPAGFRHPQYWAPFNIYGGGDLLEKRPL